MNELVALSERVGAALGEADLRLVTAESCTGGGIAEAVTAVAGSSAWFDRGVIAYSNEAKREMLGVPARLIEAHGAVSEPVVAAMADGVRAGRMDRAAVAVSGIAGPGGGSAAKPVGTVCLAIAIAGGPPRARTLHLHGSRADIRRQAVRAALSGLVEALQTRRVTRTRTLR